MEIILRHEGLEEFVEVDMDLPFSELIEMSEKVFCLEQRVFDLAIDGVIIYPDTCINETELTLERNVIDIILKREYVILRKADSELKLSDSLLPRKIGNKLLESLQNDDLETFVSYIEPFSLVATKEYTMDMLLKIVSHSNEEFLDEALKYIDINIEYSKGRTIAFYCPLQYLDRLLKRGLDLEKRTFHGNTTLMSSIKYKKSQRRDRLLQAGADVNVKNNQDRTPLILTVLKYKDPNLVTNLIDRGADINCIDVEGKTAAMYAIERNKFDIFKVLKEAGADFTIRDHEGETCFDKIKDFSSGKLLIDNGILIEKINHCFPILHEYIICKSNHATAQKIIELGGDINITDNDGNTVLHLAVQDFHQRDIKFLLENGIDTSIKNKDGHTAFDLAKDVIELLERCRPD